MKPSTEHFNLPLFKISIDSYLNLTEQMYIFNSFINLQISGFLLRTILLFHVSNIVCVLLFRTEITFSRGHADPVCSTPVIFNI